jgi:SAM-dependent methyltransferase
VLETGCGLGQWVEVLAQCGYKSFGVDFAVPTLIGASKYYNIGSRFVGANIHALPFPDATFDAVISLGVVEHFWPGPSELILEMVRTIRPGGLLFLSVPYFNPLRRLKTAFLSSFERRVFSQEPLGFYQFGFRVEEISALLEACGVVIVESTPHSVVRGISEEFPVLVRLSRRVLKPITTHRNRQMNSDIILHNQNTITETVRNRVKTIIHAIASSGFITRMAAHMMLIIGRRK